MKISPYTSVIPLNEKYGLVYSAKSDQFVLAQNNLLSISDERDIISCSDKMLNQLKRIEALANNFTDEATAIKEQIDKIDNDDSFIHIHVNPTLNCNFCCWYCYEEHQADTKMSEDTIENILAYVLNRINSNSNIETVILSFFGGEPLMYFDDIAGKLIDGIRAISNERNLKFRVHFTSNGYLLNESLINKLKDINVSFQITLDGGKNFHNKVRFTKSGKGSYDTIVKNILLLAENQHQIILRINYTSENIDSINDIVLDLIKSDKEIRRNIVIDFQRVWQDRQPVTEDEIIAKISDFVTQLGEMGFHCSYSSNIGPNHVKGSCYGDKKNHLLVNYDGNIYFCTARDFKSENSVGKLVNKGIIIWDEEKRNRYNTCKFSREVCYKCRIAPLCGGGCRQRAAEESDVNKCLYGYSAEDIDKMIINRFKLRFIK